MGIQGRRKRADIKGPGDSHRRFLFRLIAATILNPACAERKHLGVLLGKKLRLLDHVDEPREHAGLSTSALIGVLCRAELRRGALDADRRRKVGNSFAPAPRNAGGAGVFRVAERRC